tara:strand:- start:2556 stop:2792 length:237 start_codon:yes stop_codon:yes gene_type:complete
MKEKEKQCDIEGQDLEQIRESLSLLASDSGPLAIIFQALAYGALGLIQSQEREIEALRKDLTDAQDDPIQGFLEDVEP